MSDLIEAMAKAIDNVEGPMGFSYEQFCAAAATAALAALRKTHHLVPRAAGDDGELVERLRYTYEHGIFAAAENGMLAGADEAADRIEALSAEVERLRAWQNAALEVEPNIDLDIERLGAKP
jgi:hypothetical protein